MQAEQRGVDPEVVPAACAKTGQAVHGDAVAPMMLRVEVVFAHAGAAAIVSCELPAGATARDAITAAAARDPAFAAVPAGPAFASVAIWNRTCRPDTPLADGDRVELLRPITADPRAARRRKVEAERAAAFRTRWRPDARGPARGPDGVAPDDRPAR